MKNISFAIASLFTLLIFSHNIVPAQQSGSEDAPPPAHTVAEGIEPPAQPPSTPPTDERQTPAGETPAEPIASPCEIPEDMEIVHFPMKVWKRGSETKKTVQETTDDISDFFVNLLKSKESEEETDTPSIVEETAMSQFLLADLITKNPNAYVFHEFTGEIQDIRDLNEMTENKQDIQNPDQLPSYENREMAHLFQLVNTQFPEGIPEKYIELNNNQKYTLSIVGGVHALFFLNKLPVIFPSIPQEEFQRIWKDHFPSSCQKHLSILSMCPSDIHFVKLLRAEKLSTAVNKFLDISPPKTDYKEASVILAYNGAIDLSHYFPYRKFYRIPDHCTSPEKE